MMNRTQEVELIQAAYEVVTGPTVNAYSTTSEKRISKFRLEKLLKVLQGLPLSERAEHEVTLRLKALDKANERSAKYQREEEDRREARRRKWDEDHHEFEQDPSNLVPSCASCKGHPSDPRHGSRP